MICARSWIRQRGQCWPIRRGGSGTAAASSLQSIKVLTNTGMEMTTVVNLDGGADDNIAAAN